MTIPEDILERIQEVPDLPSAMNSPPHKIYLKICGGKLRQGTRLIGYITQWQHRAAFKLLLLCQEAYFKMEETRSQGGQEFETKLAEFKRLLGVFFQEVERAYERELYLLQRERPREKFNIFITGDWAVAVHTDKTPGPVVKNL